MRKIFSLIIVFLIFVSNFSIISANEKVEFYAYTTNTEVFDEYAKEDFINHTFCYYGFVDYSLKLGKGIYIYGMENPTVIYPVWKNTTIVGTFYVSLYNGEYSGSYSDGNVSQLNHAKEISSSTTPIMLVKTDKEFMYIVNDIAYDMTSDVGKVLKDIDTSLYAKERKSKINTVSNIDYDLLTTRATLSHNLPWHPAEHNGNSAVYCYAYSLSPLLKSLGYSTYSVQTIISGVETMAGNYRPGVTFDELRTYLTNEDFLYLSSSGGSMGTSDVEIWIYNNSMYIMTGLTCLTASSTSKHFGVIFGYTNSNGSYTYKIYDPQHNGTNGICTMNASTKRFVNSDGSEFIWNAGFLTYFRK